MEITETITVLQSDEVKERDMKSCISVPYYNILFSTSIQPYRKLMSHARRVAVGSLTMTEYDFVTR